MCKLKNNNTPSIINTINNTHTATAVLYDNASDLMQLITVEVGGDLENMCVGDKGLANLNSSITGTSHNNKKHYLLVDPNNTNDDEREVL